MKWGTLYDAQTKNVSDIFALFMGILLLCAGIRRLVRFVRGQRPKYSIFEMVFCFGFGILCIAGSIFI